MTQCENMQWYLDGELTADETDRFNQHLGACASCTEDLDSWAAAQEILTDRYALDRDAPDDEMVATLTARAVREGETEEGTVSRPGRRWALAAAAAVLAVSLGALVAALAPGWFSRERTPSREADSVALSPRFPGADRRPGVPLPEGLSEGEEWHLWVAGGSRVLALDGDHGLLELEEGAVVVETEAGPVNVYAGPYVVTDIGTTFQVRYDPGRRLEVTVADGEVEVGGVGDLPIRVSRSQRLLIREESAYVALEDGDPDLICHLRFPFEAPGAPVDVSEPALIETAKRNASPRPLTALEPDLRRWRQMVIQGSYARAEEEIAAFLRRRNDDPRVWSILADCRRKSADWQGAAAAYEQVLERGNRAQSERASFLLGEILQDHLGDRARALKAFDRFLETAKPGRLRGAVLLRVAELRRARRESASSEAALGEVLSGPYDDEMKTRARALEERW